MRVSGMSGNEIFCLGLKGLEAGEIVVGNSVCSLGLAGALRSFGRSVAGGELVQVTSLVSDGRHLALERMEGEARRHGAQGVAAVESSLKTLSGYTEFLAQGTSVHAAGSPAGFFTSAASGMELYCHLDAGYQPVRFAIGNVCYALGIGRSLLGSFRTFARGEVREFSEMYNHIRHLALHRLKTDAARAEANVVVDVVIRIIPHRAATLELLMTGTASRHHALPHGKGPSNVVTSELTGEELWNLARQGYAPMQLVMSTSIYSIGIVGALGTLLLSAQRGELPELTSLIYHAREQCLDLIRREAKAVGADHVVGNKLTIRELLPGLIEIMAVGTAMRRNEEMTPQSPTLIPQAIIVDEEQSEELGSLRVQQWSPSGCIAILVMFALLILTFLLDRLQHSLFH